VRVVLCVPLVGPQPNEQEATAKFQALQRIYEVLSDPAK
jgi:curved DNA-binding protein CbpA